MELNLENQLCRISQKTTKYIHNKLIKWGEINLRDFPWRKTNNIYEILIAEIFLQRTKAEQVLPIYLQFIEKYPGFTHINKTNIKEIEEEIYPLGLYKERAERLKKLANVLTCNYKCNIPKDLNELKSLPGIGEYTARALLCFGFGRKIAIVDTNIVRLYKRFFGLKSKTEIRRNKHLLCFADKIIIEPARLFNYSLLDITSAICKPRNPLCKLCPIKRKCHYFIYNSI